MFKTRILFVFCSTLAAFSANAMTFCVNKTGAGGCETVIQTAVNNAGAGDTVKIAAGKYQEQVTVPNTKTGLILMGSSATKTIIDPSVIPAGPNNGLIIEADNVQIIGLGVHNAELDGIFVATANGLIMKKSQVQNAGGDCVTVDAGLAELFEGNRFAGCGSEAVALSGNGAVFKKNRIVNTESSGLSVEGNDAIFEGNVCELVGGNCVNVAGNDSIAKKNSTLASASYTVSVLGNAALIEGNKAIGSFGVASVIGANPQVLKNTATDSSGDAVHVDCDTSPCTVARVEGNSVKVTQDNGDCFDLRFNFLVAFSADGGGVFKNKGLLCNGDGLEIKGAGAVTVEGNTIDRSGSAIGHGFNVTDAGVKTLRGNKASRAGGAGFLLLGGAHVLEKNSAKKNLQDGFFLFATANGVTLTGNDATGNGEEGFHNNGQGNTFTGNKAKGNSLDQDFCNSLVNAATFTDGGGNDFGSTTPPNQATACIN